MKAKNMALCGLFAALLAVCAWISVPAGSLIFTLQTFGIFLCLGVLGGRRGCIAILVYLLLGAAGLPVFSGFRGGFGAIFDTSGGYLMGFLACGLVYWLATSLFPRKTLLPMVAGLCACYFLGSIWYYRLYVANGGSGTFIVILFQCVVPFLLPDAAKLLLAWHLSKKLKSFVY